MPHLVFSRHGVEYLRVELERRVVIGRGPPATLTLTERSILPQAAIITLVDGAYHCVRREKLTEGENQSWIEEHAQVLRDGAELTFGETKAVFLEHATDGGETDAVTHTEREGIDPPPPLPAELWLMAQEIDGASPPVQMPLGAELVVGSGPEAGFKLHGSLISGKHACVSRHERRLILQDLQSTNGTRLNGVRVFHAELPLGVRFRVGHYDLWAAAAPRKPDDALLNFEGIITVDREMKRICAQIQRIAQTGSPVLIEGPSGSGKELVAHAIHARSDRAGGPFAPRNCGTFPDSLIAAELFGAEKGSYTGSTAATKGLFGEGHGGTVFLDEIGELELDQQQTLLRVAESGEYKPVGSDKTRKADVRIVAATNRNLHEEVRAKRFREDLFYRLAVERVTLPPLSQHMDDLLPICQHWIRRFSKPGEPVPELDYAAYKLLGTHDWPGNVRELRNAIQRAMGRRPPGGLVIERQHISFDKFEAPASPTGHLVDVVGRTLEETQKRAIDLTLAHTKGNRSRAARMLGISRGMVRRHLGEPISGSDAEPVEGDDA